MDRQELLAEVNAVEEDVAETGREVAETDHMLTQLESHMLVQLEGVILAAMRVIFADTPDAGVPEHDMLNPQTSKPMPMPCPGTKHWGIGLGRREDWEQNWL